MNCIQLLWYLLILVCGVIAGVVVGRHYGGLFGVLAFLICCCSMLVALEFFAKWAESSNSRSRHGVNESDKTSSTVPDHDVFSRLRTGRCEGGRFGGVMRPRFL